MMDELLLRHICAFILIGVGLYCLGISLFYSLLLDKGMLFRKWYHGDANQGRMMYAMFSVFFLVGGIALLSYNLILIEWR